MTPNTKKQFGIILGAIASIGAELLDVTNVTAAAEPSEPTTSEPPKAKRGPKPKTEAPTVETPTPPAAETPEPAAPVEGGKTYEELREIIRPAVEEGHQVEVKGLIVKHGGTKLADLPAASHAAFIKDVEALTI